MTALLKLEDLCVTYKNKRKNIYAVKNISFELNEGDALGIVGESGSGKSTLAMAILRLLPEEYSSVEGKAVFEERDLLSLSNEEYRKLRWKKISVVFQKSMNALSPVHRIMEQIIDIYHVHDASESGEIIRKRAEYLLSLVNLPSRILNLYPHELSGGMLQRVSIAISLLFDPRLLILDEATTALDVVTQGQILDEILCMQDKFDMTRIMITHDLSVVAQSCNKVAIIYAGELMEFGDVNKILKSAHHPYTAALVKSFPSLHGEKKELSSIRGSIPDLSIKHEGCIFAPRCDKCMNLCKLKKPPLKNVGGTYVYCHLYSEEVN